MTAEQVQRAGWSVWERWLPLAECQALAEALDTAIAYCAQLQQQRLGRVSVGVAHHLPGQDPRFESLLCREPLRAELETLLEGPLLLNSFGGVSNPPGSRAYVHAAHRDQRTWTPLPLMINLLLMLDDFSTDNGATWLLSGSHQEPQAPAHFETAAQQICAPAGSLLLFDARVWHAAGHNHSLRPRRALTLTWTRPWFKPQFDYLAGYSRAEQEQLPEFLKQIYGFYARVPQTLAEWYSPQRAWREDQG